MIKYTFCECFNPNIFQFCEFKCPELCLSKSDSSINPNNDIDIVMLLLTSVFKEGHQWASYLGLVAAHCQGREASFFIELQSYSMIILHSFKDLSQKMLDPIIGKNRFDSDVGQATHFWLGEFFSIQDQRATKKRSIKDQFSGRHTRIFQCF